MSANPAAVIFIALSCIAKGAVCDEESSWTFYDEKACDNPNVQHTEVTSEEECLNNCKSSIPNRQWAYKYYWAIYDDYDPDHKSCRCIEPGGCNQAVEEPGVKRFRVTTDGVINDGGTQGESFWLWDSYREITCNIDFNKPAHKYNKQGPVTLVDECLQYCRQPVGTFTQAFYDAKDPQKNFCKCVAFCYPADRKAQPSSRFYYENTKIRVPGSG